MRIISWFAMVFFLLEITYSVNIMVVWVRSNCFVHAAVRITPGHEKWPTQGRPFLPKAQRYTLALRKQFSRPMTGHTPRKLPAQPQSPASSQCVELSRSHAPLYYHRKVVLSRVFPKLFSDFLQKPKNLFGRTSGRMKTVSSSHIPHLYYTV